jgi:drug/metabolite transporter (DMT)-like permease
MTERKQALAALVGAALLWSVGGVLIKWVQWHPLALMSARSAVAVVLMLAVIRRPRFDWSWLQIGAALAYAATVLLYVPAVRMTTAANAILLQYTAPLWVALFGAWWLKEKPTWLDGACLAITLAGLVLFFKDGFRGLSSLGDLLAVLSGVTLAAMTLLIRRQRAGRPMESVLLGNAIAALAGLPWVLTTPPPDWTGIAAVVFMGVFQLGLAYILYCWAMKHVTALDAILVATLEPILNPIWVALLLGERPTGWALAGGALVLLAVTVRGVVLAMPRARRALLRPAP